MKYPMSLSNIFCVLLFFSVAVSATEKPSAYEELQRYGLPIGILPKGVTGYDLNPQTGEFAAYLNGTCSFVLDNSYRLNYKPVIKGVISQGRLRKLSGVSVKLVVLWLNIAEVRRRGDNLQFFVGIISANFPARDFEVCPGCGCGVNCIREDERKFTPERLVSSS